MRPLDPRLLRYARQARLPLAGLAALGVITAGLAIAAAALLATAIAGAFLGGAGPSAPGGPGGAAPREALWPAVVALAAVVAARAVTAWAREAVAHLASARAISELRRRLLARAVALGPSWLAGQRVGSLTALATTGLDDLEGYFTGYLPALFLAAVVPVAVLVAIAWADPWSGLVVALTLPLSPLFGALIGMATSRFAAERWQALGTLAHHFHDVVAGLATLKVFNRERAQLSPGEAPPRGMPGGNGGIPAMPDTIAGITDRYRRATMATLRLAFLSSFALELIGTTSVALVAVEIGLRLAGGTLDLRTALLVLILAPEAYLPLRAAGAQFHATADGLAAAEQAFTILETEQPRDRDAPAGRGARGSRGAGSPADSPALAPPLAVGPIVVDKVSVRHEGRPGAAPDGVSLTIAPGRITALAGPSGCGKSTLIGVLLGFTLPDQGRILITASRAGAAGQRDAPARGGAAEAPARGTCAGLDDDGPGPRELDLTRLGECGLAQWRALAGWVPQDPTLFPGTVADNIRLGWPQAPDDAVREAARGAAVDDVPLGKVLGDRGTGLSAGQRRRVALARALLPRPDGRPRPVLLLDEPTAGLDAPAEARIIATLRAEADRGRAILVVSHHPAVLAAADAVVVAASPASGNRAAAASWPEAGRRELAGVSGRQDVPS